ncbi:MAG: hypothetical protein RL389_488 [Actinomycetota bacterium]
MPFAHRAAQAAKLTVQKPQIALGLFHCLISEHLMFLHTSGAENMGFEPMRACTQPTFQAGAIGH